MTCSRDEQAPPRREVTELFASWRRGETEPLNGLFRQLYNELHMLAHRHVARAQPGETLRTTGLLHEAYLRLVDSVKVDVREREHFLALAARAMRFVLVDHARERAAQKRGGGFQRVDLTEALGVAAPGPTAEQVLIVDCALERLGHLDRRQAQVFELRAFGGLTIAETASVLDLSPETVKRDWRNARLFLLHELASGVPQ